MKYTIVVAEDEELLLNNLIQKIQRADQDFEVVGKAQTGSQAYELIEQLTPDVVITDIRMPVMDGITLLTKVREQFPLTKFIITSGFSDFDYARSAINLKVSDYLLKPIDPDELKTVLLKIKKEFQITKSSYDEVFNPGTTRMSPAQIAALLKDFLVENYAQDINLNLIANNLNYSPSYLTKIFCQVYDCTPSKYIINLRMSQAQKMLQHNPELSIRQIGEITGYHDQGYFSRIFKKHTGKSPIEFRGGNE
ncbi:MAG: response regulator [Eubacteriales bacterium]|nr:response regulator [Eubacteriales bacterium]